MKPILFAKPRYVYQSYVDFYRLVDLSGFEICFVDEIDLGREAVYITLPVNGELRPHVAHRRSILVGSQKAKIVWWNLERPDSGKWTLDNIGVGASNDADEILKWVDAIWTGDRWFASLDPRMIHVVLGSHPGLAEGSSRGGADWDLCHLSYVTPRRQAIYSTLSAKGLRLASNGWGMERDYILKSCRAMLNVHQTEAPIGEPLRFALAAAYGLPLLSETCADPWPLVSGGHCLMASHRNLPDKIVEWFSRSDLGAIGLNLKRLLCEEWTFRRGVEEGVKRTLEGITA